jgi:hypothetical protein
MLKVFDFRSWWAQTHHDEDQMELMSHISFSAIEGHSHLFVADVSDEDEIVLSLMGVQRDHTILAETAAKEGVTKFLYKSDDKYLIIGITRASAPFDK